MFLMYFHVHYATGFRNLQFSRARTSEIQATLKNENAVLRITHLTLHHFRNHKALDIATDAPFVVFAGANGAGKTNILEALSLLSPGRGFRNAAPSEQRSHTSPEIEWVVRAEIADADRADTVATGSAPPPAREKRLIKINGEIAPRQQALLEVVHLLWFLPTMSHLFSESGSAQRQYLDRMVYGFEREHASRLHAYAHYMRERKRLLSQSYVQNAWLDSIERSMAEYSVAIAYSRLQTAGRLTQALGSIEPVFPRAALGVEGDAETLLTQGMPALEVETMIASRLEAQRGADRQRGRASVGAHRARFEVTFLPKHMPAGQCSTGEQKALLLSLLLAQIHAQITWSGRPPIVLLDEVVAHLDAARRDALFSVLYASGAQCWTTGTDVADFSGITNDALVFTIEAGEIKGANQA